MDGIRFVPVQITLAVLDMPAMIRFYNALFGCELLPITLGDATLYRTSIDDITLILCPNAIAGVQAEQSRHQFTYAVDDLAAVVNRTLAEGGRMVEDATSDERASATLLDPDGNSLVLVELEE